tara:strand:- start:269 stop:580 length:312 start_codon:yes stop_codon:yes gene_type:complete
MNYMNDYIYTLADNAMDNIIMEDVFISATYRRLLVVTLDEDSPDIVELEPYERVNYVDGRVDEAYNLSSDVEQDRFKSFCQERILEEYQEYLRNQLKLSDEII